MPKKRKEESKGKKEALYFSKLGETFRAAKFDKRYWKTLAIDLVYSVIIGLLILGIIYIGLPSVQDALSSLDIESLQTQEIQDTSEIWPMLIPVLSAILGFGALFFFISVGFKGWVWRTIFKKKMSMNFYWKYAGFRLIMGVVLFILLALVLFAGPASIIFMLVVILLVHLFAVSLIYFVRDNLIKQSIKKGFKKGIRMHLFLLPYLFFLGILVVRSFIDGILKSFLVSVPTEFENLQELLVNFIPYLQAMLPYIVISSIIGLFFIAYMRIFYAEFVDRL